MDRLIVMGEKEEKREREQKRVGNEVALRLMLARLVS